MPLIYRGQLHVLFLHDYSYELCSFISSVLHINIFTGALLYPWKLKETQMLSSSNTFLNLAEFTVILPGHILLRSVPCKMFFLREKLLTCRFIQTPLEVFVQHFPQDKNKCRLIVPKILFTQRLSMIWSTN